MTYVLISHLHAGKDMKLVSAHDSNSDAVRRWDNEDNPHAKPRRWHAVREASDELAQHALAAYRLTERQKKMILSLYRHRGTAVKGYEIRDVAEPFTIHNQLAAKGLTGAHGMKYGAKRYFLTEQGQAVAVTLIANDN